VPRKLAGELTPTEAFHAFVWILSESHEGDLVRLGALIGPRQSAQSALTGPVEVPREAVVGLASALRAEWPAEIPAALPIDGRLLTASEVLLLLASAVQDEATPTTRPIAVADPNTPGLGWGVSPQ
jgi:hypothetical protein